MLRNFIQTALRNILKHKVYAVINFTGLTLGMALALLIISHIRQEIGFDRFHEKADRLYRLTYIVPNGLRLASTPPPIAPAMTEFFPDVENAARVYLRNASVSRSGDKQNESFEETNIAFADSALMKMFTFSFVSGNPSRALREPYTLWLTEETARKYFGNQNPVGESLILGGKQSFKIGGVIKNLPENSHLRFNMLTSYEDMFGLENPEAREVMRRNLAINFVISHSYTYVLLKPGGSAAAVDKTMPDFIKKYSPANRQIGQKFELMPLVDIHLKSTLGAEPSATNSMTNIYIFAGIGLLTLVIACINYINLSTAQSFTRIKEIGIRKILGSAKSELISQFLSESFLFCLIAFCLSYGVFYLTLPIMNLLTASHLSFRDAIDPKLLLASGTVLLVVTLLAGGYPAYFVSQFNSVASLKGNGGEGFNGKQTLRKALVVFQLMIACMLLSGSMMLIKQLNYLNERPLGFQKDHVINIPLFSQNLNAIFVRADSSFRFKLQTFRDRIETNPNVEASTMASATPGLGTIYRGAIPEGFTQEDNLFMPDLGVDYDFLKTFGMEVIAGRAFSKDFGTDDNEGFMVNETAVKEFKWNTPEQAIGKTMNREGKKGKIIGVVRDFNMNDLTTPIAPLILEIDANQWSNVSVKIKNQDVIGTMDHLKKEWNTLFPEKTFEFGFLDAQLNQQYSNFDNFGKIIQSFTAIAILISCLGVYGLVLFVVQRKVKEIGVRKVLGASVRNILSLIYREFVLLILLGFILAAPVSYYFIHQWLGNFIFHTSIDLLTYAISLGGIILVVTATIAFHAVKASLSNPVHSLRSE
jgi:putative ABC transport system permease protein